MAGGERTVIVERRPGESLGLDLSEAAPPGGDGQELYSVRPGTAAERAGVGECVGMCVVAIDGRPTPNQPALIAAMGQAGSSVALTFRPFPAPSPPDDGAGGAGGAAPPEAEAAEGGAAEGAPPGGGAEDARRGSGTQPDEPEPAQRPEPPVFVRALSNPLLATMPPGVKRARETPFPPMADPTGGMPELATRDLLWARRCTKVDHSRSRTQKRVLMVNRILLMLLEEKPKGRSLVKRVVRFRSLRRIVLRPGPGGCEVWWELEPPEHDMVLTFPESGEDMAKLAAIAAAAAQAMTDHVVPVTYAAEADPPLRRQANLAKSRLWEPPAALLERVGGHPDGMALLAGADPEPPPLPPAVVEAAAGLDQQERDLSGWEDELRAREEAAEEQAERLALSRAVDAKLVTPGNLADSVALRGGECALQLMVPPQPDFEPSPRRTQGRTLSDVCPAATPHSLASADPAPIRVGAGSPRLLLPDGALPAGAHRPPPAPPAALSDVEETETRLGRAGVSYWSSERFRPSAFPASGPPQQSPPRRELSPESLDFWVRFVQRWEGECTLLSERL